MLANFGAILHGFALRANAGISPARTAAVESIGPHDGGSPELPLVILISSGYNGPGAQIDIRPTEGVAMPLKLGPIAAQVRDMTAAATLPEQNALLSEARKRLREEDPAALRQHLEERAQASESRIPWLAALPTSTVEGTLADSFSALPAPANFSVVAADGSAVPPDRHSPLRYYLINTGHALLTYGAQPNAILDSAGHLYFTDEELHIDPQGRRIPVDGARLGLKMQVEEMRALLEAATGAIPPAVALRDGSLIMWPLHGEEKTVQAHFLSQFLKCLDEFQLSSLPVASYISYSNGQDVVNALRVRLCPTPPHDCQRCPLGDADRELCTYLGTVRDRHLFLDDELLADGKRSQVFESSSAILESYRAHRIHFFYVNVGGEIARVEAPAWVAHNADMLNLLHAVVMDQCRRSGGYPPYPPALMEAHEQAVITAAERRLVQEIVERAMAEQGLTYVRSAKDRSKRTRAV
jgi:hypothetical protein